MQSGIGCLDILNTKSPEQSQIHYEMSSPRKILTANEYFFDNLADLIDSTKSEVSQILQDSKNKRLKDNEEMI